MTPEGKKYLKGGLILLAVGVGAFAIWKIYKKVEKNILDKKIRDAQLGEAQPIVEPSKEKVVTDTDLKTSVGKKVYPKGNYAILRSSSDVNNGINNNAIGAVNKGKLAGTVIESIIRDNYVWYKIAPETKNLVSVDVGGIGKVSPNKSATTAYVREDVVTLK